jgi:tetratricopeptide (TPR) repeat protein
VIVAVLRLCNVLSPGDYPSEYERSMLSNGNMSLAAGDYESALGYLNTAIESNPEFGEAYNSRGLVHYAKGDYGRATEDLARAIELMPNSPSSHSNRGIIYYAKGDFEQAISDLKRAIQLRPTFAKAHYNLGLVHRATGNYGEAITSFTEAIDLTNETSYIAQERLQRIGGSGRERNGGIDEYLELMDTDADLALAYANRALACFAIGEFGQAVEDLQKAPTLGLDTGLEKHMELLPGESL